MPRETRYALIAIAAIIALGILAVRGCFESKGDKISRLERERMSACTDFTLEPNDATARLRCENATDALRDALK